MLQHWEIVGELQVKIKQKLSTQVYYLRYVISVQLVGIQ